MDTTDEEDENGDGSSSCHHHKTRERDSLEDLRVWSRKSVVLFTFMTVVLMVRSMRDESWKRSRLEWGTYLSKMPEKHFFTLCRMDYRTFQHVLDRTKHGMQRDYLQSERAGGFVSPEALQVGLRMHRLDHRSFPNFVPRSIACSSGVSRRRLCVEANQIHFSKCSGRN